ncbi:MAG: D-glycerate dehydrogenase [Opitutales bacterium]|nr:D-glycerate dehydrogenase [Opitutales bacterium]
MAKPKIYLTHPLQLECMRFLEEHSELEYNQDTRLLDSSELAAGIQGKQGLYNLSSVIGAEVMDSNPGLKVIANFGVGYNHIDVAAATARGIAVTNTPGVLTNTTADIAWALLMDVARRVSEGDRWVRARNWVDWHPNLFIGADITGATLGLVGLGRIGKAVLRRAKGFDMKVLYWNRTRLSKADEAELGIQYANQDALYRQSDFVSLHVALNEGTRHLMGERQLSLMKPTAFLINTTRGPVVDEKALVKALQEKRIAGAGLDVFEREPNLESELYEMENVVIPPHIGSATVGTRLKMGMMAARNCIAGCLGERPPNIVNPEIYD